MSDELFAKAFRSLLSGEEFVLNEEEKKLIPANISQYDWELLTKKINDLIIRVNLITERLGITEEGDDGK